MKQALGAARLANAAEAAKADAANELALNELRVEHRLETRCLLTEHHAVLAAMRASLGRTPERFEKQLARGRQEALNKSRAEAEREAAEHANREGKLLGLLERSEAARNVTEAKAEAYWRGVLAQTSRGLTEKHAADARRANNLAVENTFLRGRVTELTSTTLVGAFRDAVNGKLIVQEAAR